MMDPSNEDDDLLKIPPEVRERIYHYCTKEDLLSLTTCSKTHCDLTRSIIWEKIDFKWIDLKKELPVHLLNHLREWTKSVGFVGSENMKEVMESGLNNDLYSDDDEENEDNDCPWINNIDTNDDTEGTQVYRSDGEAADEGMSETLLNNIYGICNDSHTSLFKFLHGTQTASTNRGIMQANYVKIISSCNPAKLSSLYLDLIFDDLSLDYVISSLPNLIEVSLCRARSLSCLEKLKHLAVLSLKESVVEASHLGQIVNSTKVVDISLDKCDIDEEVLKVVTNTKRLTAVCISHNSTIPPNAFMDIQNLADLKKLELAYCNLTDEALSHICLNCTKITKLNISGSNSLTDLGIQCVGNLTNLLDLNIDRCTSITDNSFCFLKQFQLLRLTFGWTSNVTDSVFNHLAGIPTLQEVNVNNINNRFSVTAINNYCDVARMKKEVWHSWIFSFFSLQKRY